MLSVRPPTAGDRGGRVTANYLVVDDSRAMRAYVKGALVAALDCRVDEASSGFEAMRLLPRESYAAVIADINMPDVNGFELIRHVRATDRHADVPIVIITTQTSRRDEERARALGADAFLRKPFSAEELVRAVAQAAGREGPR